MATIWPTGAVTTTSAADAPSTPGDFPRSNRPVPRAAPAAPIAPVTPAAPAVPVMSIPNTRNAADPALAVVDLNPFADPTEFEEEIRTIVAMGFPDNQELRTVVRDFGGEVQAVIDFLLEQ